MHPSHVDSGPAPGPSDRPWYKLLNRYHWFVFVVAALGWLFDCLDQQLFILARPAAMADLVTGIDDPRELALERRKAGDTATSFFLAGWATGGLFFGVLGDRIGRAKTMLLTIVLYSLFTGLSALSTNQWDFSLYRFLTGLGVGGEFAVGVALVAEVMPATARPYTLGLLQALSALGNVSAALINLGLGMAQEEGLVESPWRVMFLVGAGPALLALLIRRRLKEPERWQNAQHDKSVEKQLGSYRELFSDPRWRKNAILGLLLACSGVIGLWAVGFFSPDLVRYVQQKPIAIEVINENLNAARTAGDADRVEKLERLHSLWQSAPTGGPIVAPDLAAVDDSMKATINGRLTRWQSLTSIMINIGAFCGMFGFSALSQRIGRKPTFAIALVSAYISTIVVFWYLTEFWQIFVMVPIMGFCQLSLFGGYAVYFPELFPTHLRSTGTSFCYNVGRFVAALGPLAKSQLESYFSSSDEPLRSAGVAMCTVFLIGLLALPFAPETKGKPLPE